VAAAAAAAAFLFAAAPASADTRTFHDGNDVGGPLDIKAATQGHAGSRFVTHSVSTYEPFASSSLQDSTQLAWGFDFAGNRSIDRFVFVSWTNGALRARVLTLTRVIGSVAVSRPDARTVRVKIPVRMLSARGYRWNVGTLVGSIFDALPNGGANLHDFAKPVVRGVRVPNPSSDSSATLTFPLSFRIEDFSRVSWQVQLRVAGTSAWSVVAHGSSGGLKHVQVTGVEGTNYELRIRARDQAGNVGVSPPRAVSVPWDDSNAIFASAYGGTIMPFGGGASYLFTLHLLDTAGTFTYTFTGTYVAVIGSASAYSPGTATITIDGGAPVLFDRSHGEFNRKRIFERAGLAPGSHTIVIAQQTGTIALDGFVFR